jgi:hypothetical protein
MNKEIDFSNACFIKFGCEACRRHETNTYMMYGIKYLPCKDYHLTLEEKKLKLLKYEKSNS